MMMVIVIVGDDLDDDGVVIVTPIDVIVVIVGVLTTDGIGIIIVVGRDIVDGDCWLTNITPLWGIDC